MARDDIKCGALSAASANVSGTVNALGFQVGANFDVGITGEVTQAGDLNLDPGAEVIADGVPRILKQRVQYTDIAAGVTTKGFAIGQLSASFDAVALDAWIRLATEFDKAGGPPPSDVQVIVGQTGDPDGLLTALSIFTGVGAGLKGLAQADKGVELDGTKTGIIAAGNEVRYTVNTVGGTNLDELTQGDMFLFLRYMLIP